MDFIEIRKGIPSQTCEACMKLCTNLVEIRAFYYNRLMPTLILAAWVDPWNCQYLPTPTCNYGGLHTIELH